MVVSFHLARDTLLYISRPFITMILETTDNSSLTILTVVMSQQVLLVLAESQDWELIRRYSPQEDGRVNRPLNAPFPVSLPYICDVWHWWWEMKKDSFLFWFMVSDGLPDGGLAHELGQNIMVMRLCGRWASSPCTGWEAENSAIEKGSWKNNWAPQRHVPSNQLPPTRQEVPLPPKNLFQSWIYQ